MFVIIYHVEGERWSRLVPNVFITPKEAKDFLANMKCNKKTNVVHKYFEHLYTVDYDDSDVILTSHYTGSLF